MKIKKRDLINRAAAKAPNLPARESEFREVVDLIRGARQRVLHAVNKSLVALYWEIGRYISQKVQRAIWGEGVVDELARYISRCHSDLRGFERRNLFRMRQFYDAYKDHKAAAPLVLHVSWSGNLLILSRCKSPEEREFYLRLAHREGWDKRETDRQLRGALFERAVLGRPKVSPAVTQLYPDAEALFKDRVRTSVSICCSIIGNCNPLLPLSSRSMNSSPNIWGSWNSISRLSIATYASHTRIHPSVYCSARRKTTKSWSMR